MNKTKEFKNLVGNKIFSATFVKKNGEKRKIVGRLGVKKHLKGGEKRYNAEALDYVTVFDFQKKEYRTLNLNTIIDVKVSGQTFDEIPQFASESEV